MSTSQIFLTADAESSSHSTRLPETESISRVHQFLIVFPACIAILSLLIYFAQQNRHVRQEPKQGRIRLPIDGEESVNGNGRIRLEEATETEEKIQDVWDIRDEELESDGYPVEEDAFWRKMQFTKLAFISFLLVPTLTNLFTLGYYLSTRSDLGLSEVAARKTLQTIVLLTPIYVYALTLCVPYLSLKNVAQHWNTTIHLCTILFITWFSQFMDVILPAQDDLFSTIGQDNGRAISKEHRTLQILLALQPLLILPATILAFFISRGPALHFPAEKIFTPKTLATLKERHAERLLEDPSTPQVPDALNPRIPNVTTEVQSGVLGALLFSFATPVIWKGYTSLSMDLWDLPLPKADMRSMNLFRKFKEEYGATQKQRHARHNRRRWIDRLPAGWSLLIKVFKVNSTLFFVQSTLAIVTAALYYAPSWFLKELVEYLEEHPDRSDMRWGWVWSFALFASNAIMYIAVGFMWSISSTHLQSRIKLQLITLLFSKTLVKKDLASGPAGTSKASEDNLRPATHGIDAPGVENEGQDREGEVEAKKAENKESEEDDVSSKAQVMTLFQIDCERVSEFSFHAFSLIDCPIEILVGGLFLYQLVGISALYGLLASLLTVPLNHFASKVVVTTQDNLMKSRDERTALMNEALGAIRMLKFMAWERKFEGRISEIRNKELKWLKRNYMIEVLFTFIWAVTPVFCIITTFLHYTLVAKQPLTPAIAFPTVSVLNELRFSLATIPETLLNVVQAFVSLRRIEKFMSQAEVTHQEYDTEEISIRSATITWPRDVAPVSTEPLSAPPSMPSTPKVSFSLSDVNLEFPKNGLTLVCGRLGSGKTLLLLGLLGEADVLAGQVICPRSGPGAIEDYGKKIAPHDWVVPSRTAYCPQQAWLQNDTIRGNILFGAPEDEDRYEAVIEACSLSPDLAILEDGSETEIGEKGVNLSGGQRSRVSLARAVYSRASTLILDDILSAVDAHTAASIMKNCFQGPLMQNRTVILVSHHIQLVSPAASYIVALEKGDVTYAGDRAGFMAGGFMEDLDMENETEQSALQAHDHQDLMDSKAKNKHLILNAEASQPASETTSLAESGTVVDEEEKEAGTSPERRMPRKLVEEERRATGRITWKIWKTYLQNQGSWLYWIVFVIAVLIGASPPVWENGWLSRWSSSYSNPTDKHSATYYVVGYAILTLVGVLASTLRYAVLYYGSIRASTKIHKRMLERILFATIRFHDTSVRGRTLNRFGKDMEGLDSSTADNFGKTVFYALNIVVTFSSIAYVGGKYFVAFTMVLFIIYFQAGKIFSAASRDMRRLDSVTKSPLYAIFGEAISGVQVLRAYGASVNMFRLMMKIADSNVSSFIWYWTLNRWISARFNLLSSAVVGVTGVVCLLSGASAASTGFALSFAGTVSGDLLFVVRRFVSLEQSMVAMERIVEYSELPLEAPEFVEPRPPASWPSEGAIDVSGLVIRYAPELPNVLHGISFHVEPRQKVGIVGATGCGKSTLALSLFRFVEPTEGSIQIDGLDIIKVGLTDLRQRVTIIPQDPTILSGTLRSTLDVFDEYSDDEIYEALRRVHLLSKDEQQANGGNVHAIDEEEGRNRNMFKDLDNTVSEGGDNYSQGEKQLICMARAILKRNKILVMDEATASIDYETDELIGKTIREEFSESTILTIAHRLATIIDYDKVLVMDKGHIAEYDSPATLLKDHHSKFYALCRATGNAEFKNLRRMAAEAEARRKEKSTQGQDSHF
ncbi:hypothetical protein QFC21_000949 [Naganishia friedmannii]|uniref:Uncharacterized protein n=1 Tax=Naganishia friedmannii TaxID=89922 RepID=A0ACC2W8G1_9TREE|nr:hypothetical protein QFC21_000949 [Naganishia friedmannii]